MKRLYSYLGASEGPVFRLKVYGILWLVWSMIFGLLSVWFVWIHAEMGLTPVSDLIIMTGVMLSSAALVALVSFYALYAMLDSYYSGSY